MIIVDLTVFKPSFQKTFFIMLLGLYLMSIWYLNIFINMKYKMNNETWWIYNESFCFRRSNQSLDKNND